MNLSAPKVLELTDPWPLKKHKGIAVKIVIEADKTYAVWAYKNVKWINWSDEATRTLEEIIKNTPSKRVWIAGGPEDEDEGICEWDDIF